MTEKEQKKLERLDKITEELHATTWYPIQWAQQVLRKTRDEGKISSDVLYAKLQTNLHEIRDKNGTLLMYAWVNIPLVYTQLVTIAVHIYFLVALFGRQYLTPTRYIGAAGDYVPVPSGTPNSVNLVGHDDTVLDFYVPFFTILQFIFYFGWLKVAETLINPFGEDDDDIDVNYIVDRNFQISLLMVGMDGGEDDEEDLDADTFGDTLPPPALPHTVSSLKTKEPAPVLPTDNILITKAEDEDGMTLVDHDASEFVSLSTPLALRRNISCKSNTSSQFGAQKHTTVDMVKTVLGKKTVSDKNENEDDKLQSKCS